LNLSFGGVPVILLHQQEAPAFLDRALLRSNPFLGVKAIPQGAAAALLSVAAVDGGHSAAIGFCFGGFAVLELARCAPIAAVSGL